MGVAAAVFAADWSNKFLIVHKTGALSHTRQPIPHAPRSRNQAQHKARLGEVSYSICRSRASINPNLVWLT
jgi:hypothetical protein